MEFSNEFLMKFLIMILGVAGFFIARYIRKHKKQNTPLVCPIRFDCHTVVHSDYARFLGIPVEILGMLYYAFIVVTYVFFVFYPEVFSFVSADVLNIFMISVSLAAFMFSAYLIGVQIFILKKGCSWCIVSAFVCLTIFILASFVYHFSLVTEIIYIVNN